MLVHVQVSHAEGCIRACRALSVFARHDSWGWMSEFVSRSGLMQEVREWHVSFCGSGDGDVMARPRGRLEEWDTTRLRGTPSLSEV
jgi:hypothetical protein